MISALRLIDFAAISPLLILLFGALLMLILETFSERGAKLYCLPLTILTMICALGATFYAPPIENRVLTEWIQFDSLARFFTILFLLVGIASALLSSSFFKQFGPSQGEYYFLLLSSIFGLILIAASDDFLTLFLGLETLSISLYVLCGYMKKWDISHESALKYFLLGAMAAAFLLYGIALIYGAVGTTDFNALLSAYQKLAETSDKALFLTGIALVTLGLAFKAAIVPFHVWAPDVYAGAPTPVTAFMAVGTKAGAFAAFARIFLMALPHFNLVWNEGIALLAYPTLIYANFVALQQVQLRRFFAYSGISHAGFLLMPLAAGTPQAIPALEFYLIVYALATLGAFAVLALLDKTSQGVMLQDLQGLYKRSPFLACVLTFSLLTLAGIPPTAGFFAKLYVFKVVFEAGYYGLVIVGLITAILSAYYYLRIIGVVFTGEAAPGEETIKSWPAGFVGAASLVLLVLLSLFPISIF